MADLRDDTLPGSARRLSPAGGFAMVRSERARQLAPAAGRRPFAVRDLGADSERWHGQVPETD